MGTHASSASPVTLHECKIQASLLLKALHVTDVPRAMRAAERMRVHPAFASLTSEQVLARRDTVRRKHALAVIAQERGFASWVELKEALGDATPPRLDTEAFFTRGVSPFLNHWFSSHEDARVALQRVDGYLFPFREQFFVCEAGFLRALGVDLSDPDWARAGRDWLRPSDPAAHERLEQKLIELGFGA